MLKPSVLLSLLTQDEAFQRMQAESARVAASSEGLDLEIAYADNNPLRQIQQLYRAVNAPEGSRPVAIIAQAVAVTGVEGAARTAVEKGIGWVLLSDPAPSFEALRRDHPARLMACIFVDNEEIGRLQGQIVRGLVPTGGTIVCVDGPPMSGAAQSRREGLERELAQNSQVKIIKSISANWTGADAERAIAPWFRHAPESARPSAIVAQNDDMAEGVARALAKERPAWVGLPITGCDGLPEHGMKLVQEKVLTATIVMPPRGGLAVEAVAKHLRNEPVAFATAVSAQIYPPVGDLSPRRSPEKILASHP